MEKKLVLESLKRIESLSAQAKEHYESSQKAKKQMKDYYNKARAKEREIVTEIDAICEQNRFIMKDFAEAVFEACDCKNIDVWVDGLVSCKLSLSRFPEQALKYLAMLGFDNYCEIKPSDKEMKKVREILISRVKEVVANNSGLALDLRFGDHKPMFIGDGYVLTLPLKPDNSYFDVDAFLEKATFTITKDATGHHLTFMRVIKCEDMLVRIPSVYVHGKKTLDRYTDEDLVKGSILTLIENGKFFPIEDTKIQ